MALNEGLPIEELEEIVDNGNCRYTYGGITYYIGTKEELTEISKNSLTDETDFWKLEVEAGNTELGLDEWAEKIINSDGIGHILNSYDGGEDNQTVNETDYIICRS